MSWILYKTTNLKDNKYYYGVHQQPICQNQFDGYFGSGKRLNLAINKHGRENFERETLLTGSKWLMFFQEKRFIGNKWKTDLLCYNIKPGGAGGGNGGACKGKRYSEEIRKKMSITNKGRVFSIETRKVIGATHKGKVVSAETRKKISDSRKGMTFSDEHKRKLSIAKQKRKVNR